MSVEIAVLTLQLDYSLIVLEGSPVGRNVTIVDRKAAMERQA